MIAENYPLLFRLGSISPNQKKTYPEKNKPHTLANTLCMKKHCPQETLAFRAVSMHCDNTADTALNCPTADRKQGSHSNLPVCLFECDFFFLKKANTPALSSKSENWDKPVSAGLKKHRKKHTASEGNGSNAGYWQIVRLFTQKKFSIAYFCHNLLGKLPLHNTFEVSHNYFPLAMSRTPKQHKEM